MKSDQAYNAGYKHGRESTLRDLKEKVEPLKMLLDTIQTSRGSINNVYLPQLSVKSVKEAREALNLITNLEE